MTFQLQQPFDARQVDPSSFAPPPPLADYHVRIVESEAKPTNDNSGGFVEFTLEIGDPGPQQGRKVPYRLNLFNAQQRTVEIAYRQLSALCYVTGVFQIQDTRQLHNIPFIATIGPQKDDPRFSNVFAVKDQNGNLPNKAGQAQPAAQAPAPAAAPPAWGAPAAAPAPAAPAWPGAAPAAPGPAAAPPWASPAAPAPPAPPAPAAPPWGAPPAAAAPPAAPAPTWGAQPAAPAPAWAPAPAAPAAPPWANRG